MILAFYWCETQYEINYFSFVFFYFSRWFFFLALTYEVTIITGVHFHLIIRETFFCLKKIKIYLIFWFSFPNISVQRLIIDQYWDMLCAFCYYTEKMISNGSCFDCVMLLSNDHSISTWYISLSPSSCSSPRSLPKGNFWSFIGINFLIAELWNCLVAYHYFIQKMEAEKMVRFSMRYMQVV